jgi:hypothetical protein
MLIVTIARSQAAEEANHGKAIELIYLFDYLIIEKSFTVSFWFSSSYHLLPTARESSAQVVAVSPCHTFTR